MTKDFVTFFSPGTFVHEQTTKPIERWDTDAAVEMAREIVERHNSRPFAFQFSRRARTDDELDSRIVKRSKMFYLGGTVLTLEQVKQRRDPNDVILIKNMECNSYDKVVENTNSWKVVQPLFEGDVVLDVSL